LARSLDLLRRERGVEGLLCGAAAEAGVSERILAGLGQPAVDLTGRTAVRELAPLLACCSVFLGNGSGAMHVAAAAGLPVVAVFRPTPPEGTAPVPRPAAPLHDKPH